MKYYVLSCFNIWFFLVERKKNEIMKMECWMVKPLFLVQMVTNLNLPMWMVLFRVSTTRNFCDIYVFWKIREILGRAVYFAANGASEERTYVDNIPHGQYFENFVKSQFNLIFCKNSWNFRSCNFVFNKWWYWRKNLWKWPTSWYCNLR